MEVRPAQTLAEAIQEVVNEVNREISDQQQIVRQTNDGEEAEEEVLWPVCPSGQKPFSKY